MGKKHKVIFFVTLTLVFVLIGTLVLNSNNISVLNPAGTIAHKERDLMIFSILLMMLVVVPVFVMTFWISVKYREGNQTHKKYTPDWDGSRLYESIWWGFPLLIIGLLSLVAWTSSHQLDPFKSLESSTKPMKIQVVALQWRWLFIYPDHHIATINDVRFPAKTPIDFEITADAPMNSLWIPKLGGQMYAMSGMSTHLHLEADKPGVYRGSSANISGEGFAGMNFTATATSRSDFNTWVKQSKQTSHSLSYAQYTQLALPSKDSRVTTYTLKDNDLYDNIVMKFMGPIPEIKSELNPGHTMKNVGGMDQ